jgi:hypothetical protein
VYAPKAKIINKNSENGTKCIRIEATASMAYSELVSDNDGGTPYRLIQNEPIPPPTKPTFSSEGHDNASTLTQITDDLVALHIGHNPNLTSATTLVDSGASHILVRHEHMHVLKDVVMSGPNTKSFASLKSAKKGSELSVIGHGLLQIGPFCLQSFIFSGEELEDTLLGLDPLTEHGCTATFTHQSYHLYYKANPEPILPGSKKANQKAWKVQIHQQSQSPRIELRPDVAPAPDISSAFGGSLQGQTNRQRICSVRSCLTWISYTYHVHECCAKTLYHRTETIYDVRH